jgi:hypothetical protein
MSPEYLKALTSPIRNVRFAAWAKLSEQPETQGGVISLEDRRELQSILLKEDDSDVQMFALMQMIGLGHAGDEDRPPAGEIWHPLSVDDWFGRLFDGPSAIFGITEKNFVRRDEDALIHLARRFPYKTYRDLEIKRVLFQSEAWRELLVENDYQTMLFVGRPWLYGPNTPKLLAGQELHFDFPNNTRPKSLPRDQLDPSYHSIRERNGDDDPILHVAHEEKGLRTDYGVVQVYTVDNGRYPMTVVQCAGTSSLGTMGAAMWLTYDLGRPLEGLGGNPIPLPPGGTSRHRMEALLRVVADTTTYAWQPKAIELCSLHVDEFTWSAFDLQWRRSAVPQVKLHMHGRLPGPIYINGRLAQFVPLSQNHRLAAAVILGVYESRQKFIRICDLAENSEIWGNRKQESKVVKQRLHTLNHQRLEGILEVGDEVRINAEVEVHYEDEDHSR